MEKSKRNALVLIALILGICVMGLWCWATYQSLNKDVIVGRFVFSMAAAEDRMKYAIGDSSALAADALKFWKENGGTWGYITSDWKLVYFYLCIPIFIISALIFNALGWLKSNNRHMLIAGILHILCLNVVSAPLCLTEYFDGKRKIQNKPFFYTWIFSAVLYAILIAIFAALSIEIKSDLAIYIYFISVAAIGIILHFIAWKTNSGKLKIIAGIVYILGVFTVISGIICIISGRDFLKAIKNKLLFYAMVISLVFIAVLIAILIGVKDKAFIYFISTGIAGFILNFIAWKTNNKKVKITAGIVYILSLFNIISAILCFISLKDNKKIVKVENSAE